MNTLLRGSCPPPKLAPRLLERCLRLWAHPRAKPPLHPRGVLSLAARRTESAGTARSGQVGPRLPVWSLDLERRGAWPPAAHLLRLAAHRFTSILKRRTWSGPTW